MINSCPQPLCPHDREPSGAGRSQVCLPGERWVLQASQGPHNLKRLPSLGGAFRSRAWRSLPSSHLPRPPVCEAPTPTPRARCSPQSSALTATAAQSSFAASFGHVVRPQPPSTLAQRSPPPRPIPPCPSVPPLHPDLIAHPFTPGHHSALFLPLPRPPSPTPLQRGRLSAQKPATSHGGPFSSWSQLQCHLRRVALPQPCLTDPAEPRHIMMVVLPGPRPHPGGTAAH